VAKSQKPERSTKEEHDKEALMKRLHAWAELIYEWHRFRELIVQAGENGTLDHSEAKRASDTLLNLHCDLMDGMPVK
jgi:hypothetical protein